MHINEKKPMHDNKLLKLKGAKKVYPKATQKSETWYSSVIESLKEKGCGTINCRSRLEPKYSVCKEIEHIIAVNFKTLNQSKEK